MHWMTIIPLAVVALCDMQNLAAWSRRRVLSLPEEGHEDYTILVPLYGHPRYFDGRAAVERYKEHILVCADVGTPEMVAGVQQMREEGWRVAEFTFHLPTAPMLMKAALDGGYVTTEYTLRLDADTVVPEGLARAVAAVRNDGSDLASVKCQVLEPKTLAQLMQAQEYRMAMLSRHYRPWLVSGACYIARTTALKEILARHTLWFLAEDSEVGRVAYQLRMRIRHVEFEVQTEAPATWRALWKQRSRIWWAGNFRHVWINFDHNVIYHPVWTLYYAALVWVGLGWKWSSSIAMLGNPMRASVFFGALFAFYIALTFAANWQVRSRMLFLIPFYSLVQAMLMPPVGAYNFARYAITRRRIGRFRFTHKRRSPMHPLPRGGRL